MKNNQRYSKNHNYKHPQEDYLLTEQEKKETISKLKSLSLRNLKLNGHYLKSGIGKHNVTLEKIEDNFKKFNQIKYIYTREGIGGKRYTIVYRLSNKLSLYLILLLNNKPVEIFDAYFFPGNIDKRIRRKYYGY